MNSNINNLITIMNKYMLIDNNISLFKCIDNDIKKQVLFNKNQVKVNNNKNNDNDNNNFFYTYKYDQLFWCFYIIKYGYDNYELNKKNAFLLEKNIKIDSIEKLRGKKDLLKINKLKLNEIENELANEKIITIKGFIALLLINDLNVFYVGDNIFYEHISNIEKEKDIFIIKYNKQIKKLGLYDYDNDNDNDNQKQNYINKIKDTHMQLFDITKQIKGLSSYKLGDLQEICHKLKINSKDINGKNLKKTLLYEEILIKLKEDSINNIS